MQLISIRYWWNLVREQQIYIQCNHRNRVCLGSVHILQNKMIWVFITVMKIYTFPPALKRRPWEYASTFCDYVICRTIPICNPRAVTHPSVDQTQQCLTSLRTCFCYHTFGIQLLYRGGHWEILFMSRANFYSKWEFKKYNFHCHTFLFDNHVWLLFSSIRRHNFSV